MNLWKSLQGLLTSKSQVKPDEEVEGTKRADTDTRISPPNSMFGRGAGGRALKPGDPNNPASPFSPLKKDKW